MTGQKYTGKYASEEVQKLNVLPKADKWSSKYTKKKPTEAGQYYWYRESKKKSDKPYIIEILEDCESNLYYYAGILDYSLDEATGWFSDEPIPEPEWED